MSQPPSPSVNPQRVAEGLQMWKGLVAAAKAPHASGRVSDFIARTGPAFASTLVQLPPAHAMSPHDRSTFERGWDALAAHCDSPVVLEAFKALSWPARADLVVHTLEQGPDSTWREWVQTLRRQTERHDVFMQACARQSLSVLPRLLKEHKHTKGLCYGFVAALENGQEEVAQLLWGPLIERKALAPICLWAALAQPTSAWFDRMRPHLDWDGWKKVLEKALLQTKAGSSESASFAHDPRQAETLMQEAIAHLRVPEDKWDSWADYFVSRGIREQGPLLNSFMRQMGEGLWLPNALEVALTTERHDLLPTLANKLDLDRLRSDWITQSKPPRWAAWDRLGCWVEPTLAEQMLARDRKHMPRTVARLRAERAADQAAQSLPTRPSRRVRC